MAGKHEGWWKCFPWQYTVLLLFAIVIVNSLSSNSTSVTTQPSGCSYFMNWMCVSFQYHCAEVLLPMWWYLRWKLGRYLFRLPEVMRVEPHDRTSAFIRRGRDTRIFSLCTRERHMSTYWEGCYLQARKRAFTKNQTIRHLDLGLSALQNCENINVLCKPPSMWHFVIATQTDEGSNPVSKALCYSHGLMGKKHLRTEISGKGLCCL